MTEKEKLVLMYKDFEVLSFKVDYVKGRISLLEKLNDFDKAPYGIKNSENINLGLSRFFNARAIASQRYDYDKIIKATGCNSGFDLSFKGHGLSLSNHYWFKREGENLKYDEINFFTNKWDDSFGKAVLYENYDALKTCDLNVPDIVTSGWGVKGWIYDNGPKLYKLGIDKNHPEEAVCEVLATKLAKRLLKENEVLTYELKKINNKYASVCSPLITKDEELVPLASVLPYNSYYIYKDTYTNKNHKKDFFDNIAAFNFPGLYEFFVKVSCFRSIAFVSDLHFDNLSAIRDMNSGSLRPAPLFDFGGAFGSSKTGRETISKANKGTLFLIYFLFSGLDPSWDYSWYDPKKLVGFEEEIKEYLSKTEFYTPDLINCVIDIYHQQKKTLDELKKGNS